MNRTGIGFSLIVSALAGGCTAGQSSADTTNAAASTTPQTAGAQSVADTNSLNLNVTPAGSSTTKVTKTARKPASTTKVSGKTDSRTQKPADRDSILGYDSVIRFPIKTLPTATSTPNKEHSPVRLTARQTSLSAAIGVSLNTSRPASNPISSVSPTMTAAIPTTGASGGTNGVLNM